MPKKKVVMLVSNDLRFDPRVPKEAAWVAKEFDVSVIAYYRYQKGVDLPKFEKVDEYKIYRYEYRPRGYRRQATEDYDITKDKLLFIQGLLYFYWLNKDLVDGAVKVKPDIVHCNDLDTLMAGYLVKRKTGAKLVYDAHELWTKQDMPIPSYLMKIMGLAEKYLLPKIDAMVSVNESIIDELEKMYNFKFKVPRAAVYNCPPYVKTTLKSNSNSQIKILYQGRYAAGRGLEELALAARYLTPKAKIYFRAKDHPEVKEKIAQIRKKYHLEKKIEFLEPVPMADLVKAGQFADIGVVPYIPVNMNNQLCSPNKLFEYMMSGSALAASDLPELRRIVVKYQNGVLFNPREPKSIGQALNKLAKDRKMLQSMQKRSLQASKLYTWENQAQKLIRLYKFLLGFKQNSAKLKKP